MSERVQMTKATGEVAVVSSTLTVATAERNELLDLTDRVADFVRTTGIDEGRLSIWSMHTTCALMINESQKALLSDVGRLLEELVARDGGWMHNDPNHSDCDRMNADSHLRAMLLGHGLDLQLAGGRLVLGQWQRVLLAELDGPRTRTVRLQAMGLRRHAS